MQILMKGKLEWLVKKIRHLGKMTEFKLLLPIIP